MVLTSKLVLPVVLGISLCSASAILLYILLKKDDDEFEHPADDTESSQFSTKEIIIPKGPLAAAIIGMTQIIYKKFMIHNKCFFIKIEIICRPRWFKHKGIGAKNWSTDNVERPR